MGGQAWVPTASFHKQGPSHEWVPAGRCNPTTHPAPCPWPAPPALTTGLGGCRKGQSVSTRWDLQVWDLSLLLTPGLSFPA